MFGSDVLETGIGLAFVFLCMSLICTAAMEGLEAMLKGRAKDLERGIRELLSDPDGTTITKTLFQHPLIRGLFAGDYDPEFLKKTKTLTGVGEQMHMRLVKRRNLPSYIPAGSFVSALMDIMVRGAESPSPYPVPANQALSVEMLRATVSSLPNNSLQRAVMSAIDRADGDLAKVKINLEAWFDASMDRVSGWYKRRTQTLLFAMGIVVAIMMNVDAITIAQRLSEDKAMRTILVSHAEKSLGSGDEAALAELQKVSLASVKSELQGIGLPLGWKAWWPAPQGDALRCTDADKFCVGPIYIPSLLYLLLGWLITSLAITLGAPFWFDTLKKLISIRSSVRPATSVQDSRSVVPPAAPVPPKTDNATATDAPAAVPVGAAAMKFEPLTWKDGTDRGDL